MNQKTQLFDPYTGRPRHPSDIASDPAGVMMLDPDLPVLAARSSTSQYRKKPVVISAKQWFKAGDHPEVRALAPSDDLFFTGMAGVTLTNRERYGVIGTLESPAHMVTPGDWIITGVKGEHYPCKPDIFAMTYEPSDSVAREEASGVVVDVRDTIGQALSDYMGDNADEGSFSIDPFDSRGVDAMADAVVAAIVATGTSPDGGAA